MLRAGSALELQRRCNVGTVWVMPAWETHKRLPLEDGIAVAEEAIKGMYVYMSPVCEC